MSELPASPPDPALCPLCGQPNRCAFNAGLPAQDCWCMQLPPLNPEARARLSQDVPLQCLCPDCHAQYASDSHKT